MIDDPLLDRARRLWTGLAGAPVAFKDAAIDVTVSPRSLLCPPGWVGVVGLGSAAIGTAPDGDTAEIVRGGLSGLPLTAMTDPAVVDGRLPVVEILGPASLAYCDVAGFRPVGFGLVEMVPAGPAELGVLLASVPAEDAGESGLAEVTSPMFVVRAGSEVIAAAGYRTWPSSTAHVSVLTLPTERGRGYARMVAAAAVSHALDGGLLPQWRARPEASRRVARALGFRELGSQLSIRLLPAGAGPSGGSTATSAPSSSNVSWTAYRPGGSNTLPEPDPTARDNISDQEVRSRGADNRLTEVVTAGDRARSPNAPHVRARIGNGPLPKIR
ncbi:GNAT family N-acetyltransferase [Plantactinospora sp. WMMC1484]|uniref:GNAT family N-acetyltransferase n=1 Tax=Plantactinospora sp. WMMC1484 TaxID=3404122 RepID=UPI003BF5927D